MLSRWGSLVMEPGGGGGLFGLDTEYRSVAGEVDYGHLPGSGACQLG